ncbi:MAG: hypothetical protein IJ435_00375 [Clostridia bacterium]|nr:hypothetical protein [Clostridia bacterium]
MEQEITFSYSYSAKRNSEIQEIRNKYLPREESKLEKLKRLDNTVQSAGMTEALCAGIGGALVFGLGMCLAMEVIGGGTFLIALGVILGIVGAIGMICAYPVYKKILSDTKEQLAPKILALADELASENN